MITILIIIIVTLVLLRFVGKMIKNLIYLFLFIVIVTLGVWYFVPEKLDKWVGANNVDKVEVWLSKKVKKATKTTTKYVDKKTEEVQKYTEQKVEEVTEETTKYVEQKVDSVLNK